MAHDTDRSVTLPDPSTAPELFEGLLTRRVMAYVIDFFIILAIAMGLGVVGLIVGVITFGLGWLLLPIVLPLAILGYYVVTLGSPRRSTIGMSMMDIVLTPANGTPLDGWQALIHPVIFWITIWISWPLSLLIALLTPRRQMLHDLLTGTLMLRRSPMVRHWQGFSREAA